jgi:predicted NAD-dependent protein-ADP-ribosyltransferase YbiA (DUF1768 family)
VDISSGSGYPAGTLSNLAPHPFIFDGVKCASMEGLLQSFKFSNPDMQEYVCTLAGLKAKFKGKKKKWWRTGTLYWRGKEIDRFSDEYQELLDRAYIALATNKKFQKALKATGNAILTHSIGKKDPKKTILTVSEFCGRLMRLREII